MVGFFAFLGPKNNFIFSFSSTGSLRVQSIRRPESQPGDSQTRRQSRVTLSGLGCLSAATSDLCRALVAAHRQSVAQSADGAGGAERVEPTVSHLARVSSRRGLDPSGQHLRVPARVARRQLRPEEED